MCDGDHDYLERVEQLVMPHFGFVRHTRDEDEVLDGEVSWTWHPVELEDGLIR